MILDTPWILELSIWTLEPLTRLGSVLASSNQSYDSQRVVASSIIDSLKENVVESVNNGAMFCCRSWNLVDRLHGEHTALASQLSANLIPKLVHLLFNQGHIGVGICKVCPVCAVVMHVDNGIEAPGKNHINNILNSLQPLCVDSPVRRLSSEMKCPGYW
jgi:hypothetical protein